MTDSGKEKTNRIDRLVQLVKEMILNEKQREKLVFELTFWVLGIVSLFMSIVNIFTKEYILLISTGVFCVCCVICSFLFVINHTFKVISKILFSISVFALFVFFTVTGHPDGFSIIWMTMMPACGLMLFGLVHGTILNAALFAEILFFFRTDFGASLLQHNYGETFMLRFPYLFAGFYCVGLALFLIYKITQNAYHRLSEYDQLTGALNRTGFKAKIAAEYVETRERKVGFIICDIDYFKKINDTYGHFAGDAILQQTCDIIQNTVQYPICRWGGEEFAVFVDKGELAPATAELIRSAIESSNLTYDDTIIKETISFGVYVTTINGGEIPLGMWKKADEALYRAKEEGRNRVVSIIE